MPYHDTSTAAAILRNSYEDKVMKLMKLMKSVSRKYFSVFCLILLGIPGSAAQVMHRQPERVNGMSYSIITNHVVSNADGSYSQRNIFLVMSPRNFTEKRLKSLMKYFLKEYLVPESMSVFLYSHDSQLRDLGKLEGDRAER